MDTTQIVTKAACLRVCFMIAFRLHTPCTPLVPAPKVLAPTTPGPTGQDTMTIMVKAVQQ